MIDMQAAMLGTVDEVIAVAEAEGIDADIRRVDNSPVATNAAQLERAKAEYEASRHWEVPEERLALHRRSRGARAASPSTMCLALSSCTTSPACSRPSWCRDWRRPSRRLDVPIYEQTHGAGDRERQGDDRPRRRARRKDHPRDRRVHRRHPRP